MDLPVLERYLSSCRSRQGALTGRACGLVWCVVALALGLASCSRSAPRPNSHVTLAPVAVPEQAAPGDPAMRAPAAVAPAGSEEEDRPVEFPAAALETTTGFERTIDLAGELEALPELPFDPEEPAVREDEVALLDELIALSLPDPPEALSHEEALLHTASELPLVMNKEVERLISYFTENSRGVRTIRLSLGRGQAYRRMIEKVLEEEDVPAELYFLAMAESGFRPLARSHAYATGMWQFISSRGKQYGLRQDRYLDLRYDAETATRAAAKHLKDLHIEFGDWYLAMAAYNCGPNRVKSAIRRTGSRDFWILSQRQALPRETRNYVPIILAMTYVGKNVDLFELGEIDPAPERRYDTVTSSEEISFELIADATESSVETIKELNQALFRSATPPYRYELRLPPDSSERFRSEIALVPPDKRRAWRRYQVRQGETLQAVAQRYKVEPQTLAELNSLPAGMPLTGGTRLTVPTTTRLTIYRHYGARAGGLLEPGSGRYRIASGDTLGGIARRFGTTVSTLVAWNGLSSTRIRAGRYLIVQQPGQDGVGAGSPSGSSGPAPSGRYTVRRGDTLSIIGARVGASVSQLRAWNGIRGSMIRVGQQLKVPGPPPARASTSAGIPSQSEPPPSSNHYRIRRGDSLSTIAEKFGVSVASLRRWNSLRSSRITAGKFLIVRPPQQGAAAAQAVGARPSGSRSASVTHYTVRRGDTLGGIAERYRVSAADLRRWNNIRGSMIHPGQQLLVQGQGGPGTYVVRRGDNLGAIARRHGTTVRALLAANGLRTSRIFPGQELALP